MGICRDGFGSTSASLTAPNSEPIGLASIGESLPALAHLSEMILCEFALIEATIRPPPGSLGIGDIPKISVVRVLRIGRPGP
jgi:hypothetical protein